MTDYADLRAALDAATQGPWYLRTNRHTTTDGRPWGWLDLYPPGSMRQASPSGVSVTWERGDKSEANATYIAAANPDTIRALLAERDALIHDNADYVGAASELATENQQLREALTKVRQVIAADRQALLDTHGNGTEIPATDELGSLALYDYDGALHTIDAALAQGQEEA